MPIQLETQQDLEAYCNSNAPFWVRHTGTKLPTTKFFWDKPELPSGCRKTDWYRPIEPYYDHRAFRREQLVNHVLNDYYWDKEQFDRIADKTERREEMMRALNRQYIDSTKRRRRPGNVTDPERWAATPAYRDEDCNSENPHISQEAKDWFRDDQSWPEPRGLKPQYGAPEHPWNSGRPGGEPPITFFDRFIRRPDPAHRYRYMTPMPGQPLHEGWRPAFPKGYKHPESMPRIPMPTHKTMPKRNRWPDAYPGRKVHFSPSAGTGSYEGIDERLWYDPHAEIWHDNDYDAWPEDIDIPTFVQFYARPNDRIWAPTREWLPLKQGCPSQFSLNRARRAKPRKQKQVRQMVRTLE